MSDYIFIGVGIMYVAIGAWAGYTWLQLRKNRKNTGVLIEQQKESLKIMRRWLDEDRAELDRRAK